MGKKWLQITRTIYPQIGVEQQNGEFLPLVHNMSKPTPIYTSNWGVFVPSVVFEDNAGAVEITNVHKVRPRTKHLNIKYHHFREKVKKDVPENILNDNFGHPNKKR